jgi:hypothetical protein
LTWLSLVRLRINQSECVRFLQITDVEPTVPAESGIGPLKRSPAPRGTGEKVHHMLCYQIAVWGSSNCRRARLLGSYNDLPVGVAPDVITLEGPP